MKIKYLALLCLAFIGGAQAGTIYLCEGYSGGMFFTNGVCSQKRAMAKQMFNVPDGMTFQQQVDMANQQMEQSQQQQSSQQVQVNKSAADGKSCPQLIQERRALDQITEKMIWVPIEQQNANYHRMNQIKADMARMGCRYSR